MTSEYGTPVPERGHFADLVGYRPEPVSPIPHEAQPYQGHRAGIVTRFVAAAIDFAVIVAVLVGVYVTWCTLVFLLDPRTFTFPHPTFARAVLVGGVLLWLYLTVGWWLSGRSYGSHVMGVRLLRFDGGRMRIVGSAVRAAFCVVFPIGLFFVVISPANRSVQDLVLRTSVVHDWTVRLPRRSLGRGGSR